MWTNTVYFNGTCEIFDLRNCSGEVLNEGFIDPCSCFNYYQCTQSFEMLHLDCLEGTAWDYRAKKCNRVVDVFSTQDCDENINAWKRCNVSDTRLRQLEQQCSAPTTIATMNSPTMSSGDACINPSSGLVHAAVLIVFATCLFAQRMKSNNLVSKSKCNHNCLDDESEHEDRNRANRAVIISMAVSEHNSCATAEMFSAELVEIRVEDDNTKPLNQSVRDLVSFKFRNRTSNLTGALGSDVTLY